MAKIVEKMDQVFIDEDKSGDDREIIQQLKENCTRKKCEDPDLDHTTQELVTRENPSRIWSIQLLHG